MRTCGGLDERGQGLLPGRSLTSRCQNTTNSRHLTLPSRYRRFPVNAKSRTSTGKHRAGGVARIALERQSGLAALALDANSRVLLLGSEGDTDPAIYREIVGRSADEVVAGSEP